MSFSVGIYIDNSSVSELDDTIVNHSTAIYQLSKVLVIVKLCYAVAVLYFTKF